MYYEVMSRGNLVHSGLHFAHSIAKRSATVEKKLEDSVLFETKGTKYQKNIKLHKHS